MPAEALPVPESAPPQESPITPLFEPAAEPTQGVVTELKLAPSVPFRQPSLLTAAQLRKLSLRHDEFARSLATRFSIYLRLDFSVQIAGLETMFYPKFLASLANPTHLTLFKLEPLPGVGLINISPSLGLAIVDRLCGGTGKVEDVKRDLSEIESALLDQALSFFLKEWSQTVAALPDSRLELAGHETNPRFLQSSPSEAGMLMLSLEARLAERAEQIHLGFPFEMIEPLVRQLHPPLAPKNHQVLRPPTVLQWNPALNTVKVPLSAQWEGLEISARQLAHLKVGDVLPVEPQYLNRIQVRLAQVAKFSGRLGKCGQNWAVELTHPATR